MGGHGYPELAATWSFAYNGNGKKETTLKAREVIRLIESNGWYRVPAKGGHRQFKHPSKPGRVTIPGNLGKDVPIGTLNSILKQAGLMERPTR